MNELGLWFQPQLVKSLEFIALILITTKNKLDKLKISDFSWTQKKLTHFQNLEKGSSKKNEPAVFT